MHVQIACIDSREIREGVAIHDGSVWRSAESCSATASMPRNGAPPERQMKTRVDALAQPG